MTWTVIGQQNGFVHIGSDSQTDAYYGDTSVDQYRSILCLQIDDQPSPGGIFFDFYNGWSRGAVRATAPVRGTVLTSRDRADTICANTFGTGWRIAEFHDGRYGSNFSFAGGWTFWAAGQLVPGDRFWVAISDQPSNPWNSAGEMPLSVKALHPDDIALKTRLQEMRHPLLTLLQNQQFRDLVYSGVARRFDGDDNVLLADIIRDAEQAQIVDTSSPSWQALLTKIGEFQNINGNAYYPQIYIPNFQDGAIPDSDTTMVILETDLGRTQLPAYQMDPSGSLRLKSELVDETYSETHEIFVLSVNERLNLTSSELASIREHDATGSTSRRQKAPSAARLQMQNVICNPTGLRNNKGTEYLQRFRVPDPSSVESWTQGKLEPRVVVVGKGGAEIKNLPFGKIKRKNIRTWYYPDEPDSRLVPWDRAIWGDYFAYKWIEIDKGPKIELSLGLSIEIMKKIKVTGLTVKAVFEADNDDMGSAIVGFDESTHQDYGTGIVHFTTCSVGGEGGTGNDNLALSAIVAASSTFPGYSPTRVKDGVQDTSLGESYSWANADRYAPNGFLPQWIQLDFGTNKTFSRVVVYTSAGYPIRDYLIQVYDMFTGTWINKGNVNGNIALRIETPIGTTTARLVRILGTSGPNHQPQYIRVNEFEVYP